MTSVHRPNSAHFARRAVPSPLEMSLPGMPLASGYTPSSPAPYSPYSPSIPSASPVPSPNSTSASSTHSLGPIRVSPVAKSSTFTPPNRNRCASLDFGPGDRMLMSTLRSGPQPTRMPLAARHSDTTQTPLRRRRVSIDENYETTAQFIEQMRKELIKQL